jgi:hypothetical protein
VVQVDDDHHACGEPRSKADEVQKIDEEVSAEVPEKELQYMYQHRITLSIVFLYCQCYTIRYGFQRLPVALFMIEESAILWYNGFEIKGLNDESL